MVTGMEAGNRLVLSRNNLSLHMPGKGCVLSVKHVTWRGSRERRLNQGRIHQFYFTKKKRGGGGNWGGRQSPSDVGKIFEFSMSL